MGSIGGGALQAVGTKTQEVAKAIEDLKNLSFISNNTPIVMPTGTILANPMILALWKFDKNGATPVTYSFGRASSIISAHVRRTAGTGNVICGLASSPDNSSWTVLTSLGSTSATFVSSVSISSMTQFSSNMEFVAVILYSNNADTSAEIKNITGQLQTILPKGWILEKLV